MLLLDDGTTAKELACGVYDTDVTNPEDGFAVWDRRQKC